jgi:uncharacterized protein (DUF1697 family)
MALIVFLRGVNVGGNRTFRPTVLAKDLSKFDVVNVGAAGTFVVRKPGGRVKFRAELRRRLPFDTEIVFCDARALLLLEKENPFTSDLQRPGLTCFVSILLKPGRIQTPLPISLPPKGEWLLRILSVKKQFLFGVYRRHMKTIGYLGQLDKLVGTPVTTRNWNTMTALFKVLKQDDPSLE